MAGRIGHDDTRKSIFRFSFSVTDPRVLLQIEEVSDYAWLQPSSLPTTRLAAKVARLAATRTAAP